MQIISEFQSTLPTRGSDETDAVLRLMDEISIHAPHEGERPFGATIFRPR